MFASTLQRGAGFAIHFEIGSLPVALLVEFYYSYVRQFTAHARAILTVSDDGKSGGLIVTLVSVQKTAFDQG
jgi:hypothetical protein